MILAPNGTGEVVIGTPGSAAALSAEDNQTISVEGGADTTGAAAGDVLINGGDSTTSGDGGDVIISSGTSATGTSGVIQLVDANGNVAAEVTNAAAASGSHIDISAGTTSANITVDSDLANADLLLTPKGTGQILVPVGYVPTTDDSLSPTSK